MDDIRPRQKPAAPPAAPQPAAPAQPTPDSPEGVMVESDKEQKQRVKLDHKMNKRKKGPIIAIVLAVIITLGLIGGAVYMYWRSSSNKQSSSTSQSQTATTQTDTSKALETSDVDNTTSAIDKQLDALNNTTGFNTNDLTDSTLGLN